LLKLVYFKVKAFNGFFFTFFRLFTLCLCNKQRHAAIKVNESSVASSRCAFSPKCGYDEHDEIGSRYLSRAPQESIFFLYAVFTSSRREIYLRSGLRLEIGPHLRLNADRDDATHSHVLYFFFLFHFLARFIARVYSLRHLRVTHIRTYACIHRHRPVVTRFPSRQFVLGFRLFVFSILLFLIFSCFFLFIFCLFDFSF